MQIKTAAMRVAFDRGVMCYHLQVKRAPAHDPEFISWACAHNEPTVDLLKAWLYGWDMANLAAPEEGDMTYA